MIFKYTLYRRKIIIAIIMTRPMQGITVSLKEHWKSVIEREFKIYILFK